MSSSTLNDDSISKRSGKNNKNNNNNSNNLNELEEGESIVADNSSEEDGVEVGDLEEPALERSASRPRIESPVQSFHSITIPKKEFYLLQLSTYSLLVFATIWGVLGRLGLNWLGTYAKDQVFVLIWAQIVGCLIMGFLLERKVMVERIFPPLFVAIGTGFCGSMTTFSSWMLGVFVAFSNLNTPTHGRFSGFFSGVAVLVVTIGLASASLNFGAQLSSFLPNSKSPEEIPKSSKSIQKSKYHFHICSILLGPIFYLGSILLLIFGPNYWRSRATFAIFLGPPGTLLRYYLSKKLNPLVPTFPIGTLSANLIAVFLISLLSLFQRYSHRSNISCEMLQGFEDGFCGSLSTVSTFVVELRNLKKEDSMKYFWVSVICAQLLLVIILGSWIWSDTRTVCTF